MVVLLLENKVSPRTAHSCLSPLRHDVVYIAKRNRTLLEQSRGGSRCGDVSVVHAYGLTFKFTSYVLVSNSSEGNHVSAHTDSSTFPGWLSEIVWHCSNLQGICYGCTAVSREVIRA